MDIHTYESSHVLNNHEDGTFFSLLFRKILSPRLFRSIKDTPLTEYPVKRAFEVKEYPSVLRISESRIILSSSLEKWPQNVASVRMTDTPGIDFPF